VATLYELHDLLREALAEHVDPETGEISDAGLEKLAAVEMALEAKALNVASYVVSLRAKADGFKGEAESVMSHATALKRRGQACENEAKRLLEYLQMHLEDGQKLEDERVRISWGTATSVGVDSKPEQIPERFLLPPGERRPDKKALSDAIKAGDAEAAEHAHVSKRRFVKVR
jgi:hypothetical protein